MEESWWENIVVFLCRFWWILVLIIVLSLTAYFTRSYWLPLLQ